VRQNLENSADIEFIGNGIGLIAHCGIVKTKIIHIVGREIVVMKKMERRQTAAQPLTEWFIKQQAEMIAVVREMVLRESPTHDKQACDALCAYLADRF